MSESNKRFPFDFSNRRAFVSGGSRGIGYGIADALVACGARVAIGARDANRAEQAARTIAERHGSECFAVSIDVRDDGSVKSAFATIGERFGALDVAVNSAGVANSISFADIDDAAWDQVIDTNLKGVHHCCRAELALMPEGGSIVNIASISGSMVNVPQFQANYNTSKAGVIMLTRSIAVEFAQAGVRCNSVSPGYTLTDMNKRPEVQDLLVQWKARTPMGRLAEVDEVAAPVLFLASDMASFVTGHDFVVDGGITIVC